MIDFSFSTFLVSIIGGIIASVLISLEVRWSKPKLEISEKIAEKDGQFKYKIQNNSNRDIGDIYIRVTYRTTTKGNHSYSEKSCPILHGKKENKSNHYNEITVRFDNAKLSSPKTLVDPNHSTQSAENKPLEETIEDFFRNNANGSVELEVSYYDYNLIYGAVRRFKCQKYETINCIEFNSVFVEESLEPKKLQDSAISYLKT